MEKISQEEYEKAQNVVWDYEDQLVKEGKAHSTPGEEKFYSNPTPQAGRGKTFSIFDGAAGKGKSPLDGIKKGLNQMFEIIGDNETLDELKLMGVKRLIGATRGKCGFLEQELEQSEKTI
ncbi:MAG: hypothetical protein ABJF65_00190 [Reichenbachiella sp.]|uniref:hypothetical protein n=1 Tax=Reichenbachiella sp. TaxID=2184521 RepID=UPI0032676F51